MNIMRSELPPGMDLSPYGTPVHDLWGEFLIYRLSGGAFTTLIWCKKPRLI